MTRFAIDACFADANGIRKVLVSDSTLYIMGMSLVFAHILCQVVSSALVMMVESDQEISI